MPGTASVCGREISLSRRQHVREEQRQDGVSSLRNPRVRRHSARLHRPDLERHPGPRLAGWHCRPRIPRRGRDGQCADPGTESARRRGHRRPDPRRRIADRGLQRMPRHFGPDRRHRQKIRQGGGRRGHRPHPPRLCLRDRRAARHVRRQIRHARYYDRSQARSRHARRDQRQGRQQHRPHGSAREECRANRADRILRQAGRADRQPPGGVGDINAVARAQQRRRKPARRHHRRRATRGNQP